MNMPPLELCKNENVQQLVETFVADAGDETMRFFLALYTSAVEEERQELPSGSFTVAPRLDERKRPQGPVCIPDDKPSWDGGPRRTKKKRKL